MKTIQDVLEWLQKSEDEGIYEVGTQNVKRHLESVLKEQSRQDNVSGRTFTIDDRKEAFMAGADKKNWTKIPLTDVVSGQDYVLEPVFEKWLNNLT